MNSIREVEEEEEGEEEKEERRDASHDLVSFRQEWKRELEGTDKVEGEPEDEEDDVHIRARELFLQGAEYEGDGKLFEAIRCYKRAEKLVPNIEFQTFDYTGRNKLNSPRREVPGPVQEKVRKADMVKEEVEEEEGEMQNLVHRFVRMRIATNSNLIQPEIETSDYHLGDLPSELLNYILKWVVSSDLDLRSLESCSAVCRELYIAARDPDIWRLACLKVWGQSVTTSNLCSGWRELYIMKPRVNFHGCYISKISYIREGERGFQDQETFRAWHVVEYHRFVRFFPGGQVAMLTSANDDPALVAKQMNTRQGCVMLGAMMGNYKIADHTLVCVLKKAVLKKKTAVLPSRFRGRKKKEENPYQYTVPDQDFHLQFQIRGSRWKTLQWVKYLIVNKYKNGMETEDQFDISNGKNYPRLQFTRVGCYHFESNTPL